MRRSAFFTPYTAGVVLSLILPACSADRLVRKSVEVNESLFEWYFYSHIGNFSSERITVTQRNADELLLFESEAVATDFEVRSDTVIIHIYAPVKLGISYVADTTVYGYTVVLDTTATLEDFMRRPDWRRK
jgi:hypothetical protein